MGATGSMRRDTYTTGEIARVLQVSPRTVSVYFDSGLLRGWRVPAAQGKRVTYTHRRASRADLIAFCLAQGMPVPAALLGRAVGLVWSVAAGGLARRLRERLPARLPVGECPGAYELGTLYDRDTVAAVVVDVATIGTGAAMALGRSLSQAGAPEHLVALVPEGGLDCSPLEAGYTDVLECPVDVDALARLLAGGKED